MRDATHHANIDMRVAAVVANHELGGLRDDHPRARHPDCKATSFSQVGKKGDRVARVSTVAAERGAAGAVRDSCGSAGTEATGWKQLEAGMRVGLSGLVRTRFVVLWIVVLAAGCASQRLVFDVTSDIHEAKQADDPAAPRGKAVAEAIRDMGPGQFMLTSGDMVSAKRVRTMLDQVLGDQYAWYPALGNHDLETAENLAWLREYNAGGRRLPRIVRSGPPGAVETCYSFDYGNAHFVALNQYYDGQRDDVPGGDVGDALYQWLAEDLFANRKPIIFVYGHEPYLPLADLDTGLLRHRGDSLDANPASQHRFWSLLRQHHVTAYVCGHTHCVSVAKLNGVWQLNVARPDGTGDKNPPGSFLRIRVDGDRVDCDVYRSTGNAATPFVMTFSEQLR